MSRRQNIVAGFWLLLFLVACYFPLFLHLDSLGLRLWDEARRGVNALEMAENGHWLVPHFMGMPDNWGTKPPLLIWLQAIGLKLIHSPELAIRLPSALAGLATAFLYVWVGKRILHRPIAGYFSALVLLTSGIYIESHAAVAGDYDALLSLWLNGLVFSFYLFLHERQDKWLYLSGLFLLLAGWTKGIAAFFFAPGLFIFALSSPSFRPIFKNPKLYIVAFSAFAGIAAYYLIREGLYPGYLATVWENELGGRYFEAKEGHAKDLGFYLRIIHQYELFFPWQYFLPLGFWLLWKDRQTKSLAKLLLILSCSFILILSLSATKLSWYILPLIPLLSLIVGSCLESLFSGLRLSPEILTRALFILAIFTFPYVRIVQKVYSFSFNGPERERQIYRDFFRQLSNEQPFTVVLPAYNGHFTFYQQFLKREGYDIHAVYLKKPALEVQATADTNTSFEAGALVGFCEQKAKDYVEKNYQGEILHAWDSCTLLRLK